MGVADGPLVNHMKDGEGTACIASDAAAAAAGADAVVGEKAEEDDAAAAAAAGDPVFCIGLIGTTESLPSGVRARFLLVGGVISSTAAGSA